MLGKTECEFSYLKTVSMSIELKGYLLLVEELKGYLLLFDYTKEGCGT
jgi:hypothetical protein